MNNKNKNDYLPEIDGLRALAVLAVIINHFNKDLLPGGYLGVDIFFVISGYVITGSLAGKNSDSLYMSLAAFYSRRVKRLYPALLLCVLVTGVAAALFNPQPLDSLKTGLTALFGFSNFFLLFNSTNYFGEVAELNFFTHTWTLGVEEQFYLVFPLVFLLMMRSAPTERNLKNLLILLVILFVLSVSVFVSFNASKPDMTFFMMPFRFWELAAGCILFVLKQNDSVFQRFFGKMNTSVLLVLLIAVMFIPPEYLMLATLGVVGLTTLLITTIGSMSWADRLLRHPYVIFIGLMSYSLYLWHWSVIVLSRWTIGFHWWSVPIQLVLIFALAFLSYRYVEKPLRLMQWSKSKILDFVYAVILSIVASVALLALVDDGVSRIYLGGGSSGYTEKIKSQLVTDFRKTPEMKSFLTAIQVKKRECNLTPHHLKGKSYRPAPLLDDIFISNCMGSEKRKVLLMGDSFANAVSTHVALAAHAAGYEFSLIFGYSCPYPLDIKNIGFSRKKRCEYSPDFLKDALRRNLNPGDVVVLRSFFQKAEYISVPEKNVSSAVGAYDSEIFEILNIVKSRGSKLLIIGSNGEMQTCSRDEWFNKLQCPKSINMLDISRNQYVVLHNVHLSRLAMNDSEMAVINPLEVVCSTDFSDCSIETSELRFMRDSAHLSGAAVDKIYPEILSRLRAFSKEESFRGKVKSGK